MSRNSRNNPQGRARLGNTGDGGFNTEQLTLLEDFFKNNPVLLKDPMENTEEMDSESREDYLENLFYETENGLLGNSSYFVCRVMDKCTVTYSPEDVYLEEIQFEPE